MSGRILAVDPGQKRIGLAISDPSGMIASPLMIVNHISRIVDAAVIAQTAQEHGSVGIVVGQALDSNGEIGPSARHAQRLVEAIRDQTDIPVVLWDESYSSTVIHETHIAMGVKSKKAREAIDDVAAAVILQDYLNHIHESA